MKIEKIKCLVLIDLQNGFVNEYTQETLSKIKNELLDYEMFDWVVGTSFYNHAGTSFSKILNWKSILLGSEESKMDPIIKENLDKIFKKDTYTCFTKEFEKFIKQNHIEEIYIAGFDTDGCVLKSCFDCFEKNIPFYIMEDYCASSGGRIFHDSALMIMKRSFGDKCIKKSTDAIDLP